MVQGVFYGAGQSPFLPSKTGLVSVDIGCPPWGCPPWGTVETRYRNVLNAEVCN